VLLVPGTRLSIIGSSNIVVLLYLVYCVICILSSRIFRPGLTKGDDRLGWLNGTTRSAISVISQTVAERYASTHSLQTLINRLNQSVAISKDSN
jgi:hypothetical protein